MSLRAFCQRCAAEVEDTGGFCLLGHRLAAAAPPPPPPPPAGCPGNGGMDDLAEAVAEAFDEAGAKVAAAVTAETMEAGKTLPSRYASSVERTWAQLESAPAPSPDDPINSFAPPPRMDWGPQRSAFRLKLRRSRAEASV